MKKTFFTEAAYLIGIIVLAFGTALMERANFGMSMIVAPAYILHMKFSERFSFFTFGVAEYVIQALLILALILIHRKAKRAYLFSFCTAVFYGFVLDRMISLVSPVLCDTTVLRVLFFVAGMLLCSIGVALLFNTYISPEAYEVFVKEISEKCGMSLSRFKTIYDCSSCVISILLSFVFFGFGQFVGIHVGTVVCAVLNGFLIGKAASLFKSVFEFRDGLPLRKVFEG